MTAQSFGSRAVNSSQVDLSAKYFDPDKEKRYYGIRKIRNLVAAIIIAIAAFIGVGLLTVIVANLLTNGIGVLNGKFLTADGLSGGIGHAIIGTLLMVGFAALIAVPVGVLAAIYLAEYKGGWITSVVRFSLNLLAQMPSIVLGLFVWMFVIKYQILRLSGFAGALALVLIILPIVARTVEEILLLVPSTVREAAYGLGAPKWYMILTVVLPTVAPGILTGVILSLARAAGETAPILLVTGNDFVRWNIFNDQVGAIPLQIYKSTVIGEFDRAYGAAVVLVIVIGLFSAVVRYVTDRLRTSIAD